MAPYVTWRNKPNKWKQAQYMFCLIYGVFHSLSVQVTLVTQVSFVWLMWAIMCFYLRLASVNPFAGSEIYQETLIKALAKNFGARVLIVDSLLLPGVSFLINPDFFLLFFFKLVYNLKCPCKISILRVWFMYVNEINFCNFVPQAAIVLVIPSTVTSFLFSLFFKYLFFLCWFWWLGGRRKRGGGGWGGGNRIRMCFRVCWQTVIVLRSTLKGFWHDSLKAWVQVL